MPSRMQIGMPTCPFLCKVSFVFMKNLMWRQGFSCFLVFDGLRKKNRLNENYFLITLFSFTWVKVAFCLNFQKNNSISCQAN